MVDNLLEFMTSLFSVFTVELFYLPVLLLIIALLFRLVWRMVEGRYY